MEVDITESSSVIIPLEELLKVRSKINAPDENISLAVTSCCGLYSDDTEVQSVYFEWYDSVEDPQYQKKLEKYQIELQKYNDKKSAYEDNLRQ